MVDSNRERCVSLSRNLMLYKSEWRTSIIQFCGWTTQTKKGVTNPQLNEICEQVTKQEAGQTGSHMRACVMAALHQDFSLAISLASSINYRENYGENDTNYLYFINTLKQL